ncbi:MAG: hypothetical protein K5901_02300, partial [Bacteroidales bacterium]|nr:hypothetical protein [Bacteroidales bacterium]
LAVGCWLLAVGCWLLAVGCWLFYWREIDPLYINDHEYATNNQKYSWKIHGCATHPFTPNGVFREPKP